MRLRLLIVFIKVCFAIFINPPSFSGLMIEYINAFKPGGSIHPQELVDKLRALEPSPHVSLEAQDPQGAVKITVQYTGDLAMIGGVLAPYSDLLDFYDGLPVNVPTITDDQIERFNSQDP